MTILPMFAYSSALSTIYGFKSNRRTDYISKKLSLIDCNNISFFDEGVDLGEV
jgi:hypothetical protein